MVLRIVTTARLRNYWGFNYFLNHREHGEHREQKDTLLCVLCGFLVVPAAQRCLTPGILSVQHDTENHALSFS